jgi:hypothetical protein
MKMIKLTKNVIGAGAAAAALVGMSVPVQARDFNRDRDGITAGEVIAGAVILGGIAAVLSSKGGNDRYDDQRYDDRGSRYDNGRHQDGRYGDREYGYSRRDGSRSAVNQCVRTVEGYSNRHNGAKVTEIRDIERTRYGYKVTGKIVVRDGYRNNDRDDRYGRDDRYDRGNDYRGRGYESGYDKGRFTCYVERGRVVDVNYKGLDQWR